MYQIIDKQLRNSFYNRPGMTEKIAIAEKDVLAGTISSFEAARRLL